MAGLIEIYNYALIMIGDDIVMAEGEDSARSKACDRLFPLIRDAVFRAFPWNCLKVDAELAQLAAEPITGYGYQYTLPTDPHCLWVPKNLNLDLEYIIKGRTLHTDDSSPIITYIARITEPGVYDSLLVDCLATRLAATIASGLTGKTTLAQTLWKLYEYKIVEAYHSDSAEGEPLVQESDDLLDVR